PMEPEEEFATHMPARRCAMTGGRRITSYNGGNCFFALPPTRRRVVKKCCVVAVLLLVPCLARAEEKKVSGPLSYTMKGIDGKDVDLAKYKGKVVVIVNVASRCGLTPHYER